MQDKQSTDDLLAKELAPFFWFFRMIILAFCIVMLVVLIWGRT